MSCVGSACKATAGTTTAEARAEKVRADAVRAVSQRSNAFDRVFSLGVSSAVVSAGAGPKKRNKGVSALVGSVRTTSVGSSSEPAAARKSLFRVVPPVGVGSGGRGSGVDIGSTGSKRGSSSVRRSEELRVVGSRLKRRARTGGCSVDGPGDGRADDGPDGGSRLLRTFGRKLIVLGLSVMIISRCIKPTHC